MHKKENNKMAGKISYKFKDYSNESSTVSFVTDAVTNATVDAIEALNGALKTAIEGVTKGRIANENFLARTTDNGQAASSEPLAARELKWLLHLVDSVSGEVLKRELPTPDITLRAGNSDQADMTNAAWVSLKGAIDGNYNNPETGDSLLLISAKLVGRNI